MTDKDLKLDRYKQALKKIKEECDHYRNAPRNFGSIYAKASIEEIIDIIKDVDYE